MKTLNLTQSRTRNDPINRWTQDFSFRDLKNEVQHSSCDLFLFFSPNLDFKPSLDAKMSIEKKEVRRFEEWVV